MREIEFRGKSIDDDEWVYGSIISKYDADACGYCNFYIIENPVFGRTVDYDTSLYDVVNCGDYYEVKEETIGQYTGLKDKNGTKIFEGDIVELESHGFIPSTNKGVVVFHEGSYCIKRKSKYFGDNGFHRIGEVDEWQDMSASGKITYTYEVIGNIYDNPELLECNNE